MTQVSRWREGKRDKAAPLESGQLTPPGESERERMPAPHAGGLSGERQSFQDEERGRERESALITRDTATSRSFLRTTFAEKEFSRLSSIALPAANQPGERLSDVMHATHTLMVEGEDPRPALKCSISPALLSACSFIAATRDKSSQVASRDVRST